MAKRPARSKSGYTFAALLADYEREHAGKQRRLHGFDRGHLERALGRCRLRNLTEKRITDYGLDREKAGAHVSVINDELMALGWVLDWARDTGRLTVVPRFSYMRVERRPIEHRPLVMPGSGPLFPRGLLAEAMRTSATSRSTERAAKRGTLSAEALAEHLERHPIDRPLSNPKRAALLKSEQGITVHQTTLLRRLKPHRPNRT